MKTNTRNFLVLPAILCMLPALVNSQQIPLPDFNKKTVHHEVPDDPYLPNPYTMNKVSTLKKYMGSGFSMVQVNVNSNGENILGDAANEPSIAIDPTDPDKMVIGWRQFDNVNSNFRQAGYGYSTDGGQSWTFPGVIQPGVFRSDPVLDYDTSGIFYFNSLTSGGGNFSCQVFKSLNGGALWDAGTDAHGGDKQWMAIDRSGGWGTGNIYSSWTAMYSSCQPGFFTRSTDGGNFFEGCSEIPGQPYWGTMAVNSDGDLYVAGSGGWYGILVAKSTNAQDPGSTVSWDFAVSVDLDGYLTAQTAVNPAGLLGQVYIDVDRSLGPGQGNVYLLASVVRFSISDPADVMFSRSTDGGLTWSAAVRVNDDPSMANYQWFGTMSVAPNGRIDAVWLDTRDAPSGQLFSSLYYSYSLDQGETWSANEKLTDYFDQSIGYPQQEKMGDYFDMESDETGAHLAWANTFNDEEDVYYSRIISDITSIEPGDMSHDPLFLSCFPNPFCDRITIRYTIPRDGDVRIVLYNSCGKEITTLLHQKRTAGTYTLELVSDLAPGYYECCLTSGGQSKHIGLIKVR
jgi:hypothetical protein